MLSFLFGKKKKKRSVKKSKSGGKGGRKPPAALLRMCKKYRIKVTRKVGRRRVYKKVSVLKKQLKRKMKMNKHRRSKLSFGKKRYRRSRFGELEVVQKIQNIIDLKKEVQNYKINNGNSSRLIKCLKNFSTDTNHFYGIYSMINNLNIPETKGVEKTDSNYLRKMRILGAVEGNLGVFKICMYDPIDDYDDHSGCPGIVSELRENLRELIIDVLNGSKNSFGKKRYRRSRFGELSKLQKELIASSIYNPIFKTLVEEVSKIKGTEVPKYVMKELDEQGKMYIQQAKNMNFENLKNAIEYYKDRNPTEANTLRGILLTKQFIETNNMSEYEFKTKLKEILKKEMEEKIQKEKRYHHISFGKKKDH